MGLTKVMRVHTFLTLYYFSPVSPAHAIISKWVLKDSSVRFVYHFRLYFYFGPMLVEGFFVICSVLWRTHQTTKI
jgi:hypothetical protein